MSSETRVSAIMIFLNAEQFIGEAINSVLAQTYPHWELLLVDDGSSDRSTQIARRYATRHPGQVRYLEHLNHQNQGKGTSRNLGIQHARGEYLAFLDADDVWLPYKLAEQVAIMETQPEAGMLYGRMRYWYSWTGRPEDRRRDYIPRRGVPANTLIQPPRLLPLLLRGKASSPGTCTILARRAAVCQVGGFDEGFVAVHNLYEDLAFYAKVYLRFPVYAADACWAWYRQHPGASMAVGRRMGYLTPAMAFFLKWLRAYLLEQGEQDPDVWQALDAEQWRVSYPAWLPASRRLHTLLTLAKGALLRLGEGILPVSIRRRLWSRRGTHQTTATMRGASRVKEK
ncbi:MAG: glycosyltransferase family 2 protein [Anaerolineae bacterium]|nr:glycosyltransferase family 2 protein [Anaerolineae bacterium]